MKLLRRNILTIFAGAVLSLFGQSAEAAGPTLACTKVGQKIVFRGYQYACVKISGKLVWKKGAKIVASPSATPTQSASPSASVTTKPTPTATASALTFVAKVNDIGMGHTKIVEIKPASGPSFSVAVTRSSGEVIVLSAICTHQGCTVEVAASELSCPCHGSAYNWTTGAVNQGPAQVALKKFAVTEDAGSIFIKL